MSLTLLFNQGAPPVGRTTKNTRPTMNNHPSVMFQVIDGGVCS